MTLLACGINHETSSLSLRERLFIPKERMAEFISLLLQQKQVNEVVVLSTCNRTEIYAEALQCETLLMRLAEFCGVAVDVLCNASYCYVEQDMVRHLMRVASGLDSMVLGEPQVFGQLKEAVGLAEEQSALGPCLFPLFQQIFSIAKKVRTQTEIGACPVSVASTAVKLAEEVFSDLSQAQVLLIGAGDTVNLVAKHLQARGVTQLMISSRHLEKAEILAAKYQGTALSLQNLSHYLWQADVVFTATASTVPILGKGAVETALKKRNNRLMFMVDIAVPRDIEPEVAELENVHLYTLDDLKKMIQMSMGSRQHAAQKAEEMIAQETQHYMKLLQAQSAVSTLRAFRQWAQELREEELNKAMRLLKQSVEPEEVLKRMASALMNKLMHPPTVKIREASYEGRTEFVEYLNELFDLDN